MIDTYSRHRPFALLAIVVVAQVLLLAFQIKGEHDVRLIRYWAVALVTPLERAGTWTFSKVGGAWGGYVGLRNARAENDRMRVELDQLRLRNRELESQAAEAQRLTALLNFHNAHPEATMLAAQVIGSSADPTSHTLFINRGEHDRLRMNMGVVTPDGIVGKIVEVLPNTAQVLLINDKDSGVGALFSASRTHGVVRGSGDPEPRMDYVVSDEKVQAGDAIVTSGEDRIFPKDFPIGTVESAKAGNPFQVIRVQPSARLDRLEEVLVLLSQQEVIFKKPKLPQPRLRPARRQPQHRRRILPLVRSEMAYMLNVGERSDPNVEVHKFYGGAVLAVCLLALVFQAFLHKYGRWSELIDLPLLVTIYFGVSRRNPVTGLFLGGTIGILQDALSHDNPIGMYGIAKTIIGYLASSIGGRIDTEHPLSRFALVFVFFHLHQVILAITQRVLLNHSAPLFTLRLFLDSLVTAAFAVPLFALLDRLRRPS